MKPKEAAEKIMALFARMHVAPGECYPPAKLNQNFLNDPDCRAADFKPGLQYAVEQGLLTWDGKNFFLPK